MKNDLHSRFTAALKRLEERHPTAQIEMPWFLVVMVIASVQLALRHPGNNRETSRHTTAFVKSLILEIAALEPDLALALDMGFHPEHDIELNDR